MTYKNLFTCNIYLAYKNGVHCASPSSFYCIFTHEYKIYKKLNSLKMIENSLKIDYIFSDRVVNLFSITQ